MALESWVLDGVTLTSGSFLMMSLQADPPKAKPQWVSGADSEWATLVGEPLHENREFVMKLRVPAAANMDAALDLIASIRDKLRLASRSTDGITLVWTPNNSARSRTFDVLHGEITELPIDKDGEGGQWMRGLPIFSLALTAKPYWYDSSETLTSTANASTPLVTIDVAGVGGDVPALARLIVTDAATQPRRDVEWGLQNRDLNAGLSYIIESDSMVTSGFTGTQTTRSGAYDPGAAGNSIIRASTVLTSPVAVCGTGSLSHIGTFRVWARCYVANSTQRVRLAWRAGDDRYTTNSWATPPSSPGFVEIDLGTITIPTARSGTQVWDGRIDAYETDTTITPAALDVDYLRMTPAGEGYGRARAVYSYSAGTTVAYDGFTGLGANVAVTGRVATLGGTWASTLVGAGTTALAGGTGGWPAPDLYSSQMGSDNTRLAILGSTNYTDIDVGITTSNSGLWVDQGGPAYITSAVMARYVDQGNHVKLLYIRNPGYAGAGSPATAALYISMISTATGSLVLGPIVTLPSDYSLYPFTLRLIVYATGHVFGLMYGPTLGSNALVASVSGYHSALATGGTLATGKFGIWDATYQFSSTVLRIYDNFTAATPPAFSPVVNSTRSMQFRHDDTIRLDSTGLIYGKPQSYRGSRFMLPVGTTRVAVAARRSDLDTSLADNVTDSTTLQVAYRTRGLVVPRA